MVGDGERLYSLIGGKFYSGGDHRKTACSRIAEKKQPGQEVKCRAAERSPAKCWILHQSRTTVTLTVSLYAPAFAVLSAGTSA